MARNNKSSYSSIPVYIFLASLIYVVLTGCTGMEKSKSVFEQSLDIGLTSRPGTSNYASKMEQYSVTGAGDNIWGEKDAFYYLCKQVSGDLSLRAKIRWTGEGKNEHRKAGWMIRRELTDDSPYVDAVIHGDGLTSLQYRKEKGGPTQEIKSPISKPAYIWIERHGHVFSLSVSKDGKKYQPVGSLSVDLGGSVYAGLAVCSHDDKISETAVFTDVDMKLLGACEGKDRIVESTLEIIDIETGIREIVYRSREHFEAPNWSLDGKFLLFNSGGKLYTIPSPGGKPKLLDTAFADHCNNDHGFSPDGKQLAISHHYEGKSLIYILPVKGGAPQLVTELGPSYWHGWSPDGKALAYCAERNGNYDVYAIPVEGGKEIRLTDAEGLDDGPDYSPDGRYIYFNSVRTGSMKIWRMNADGTNQVQITNDDQYGDWFPHPSPDGKCLVFVSYDSSVEGHPANKDVALRIMPADGGKPKVLAQLFGGQGTINVPSWSPDSKRFAFVSYRLVGKDNGQ